MAITSSGIVVQTGQIDVIGGGQIWIGTIVESAGQLDVADGAEAGDTTINTGGNVFVESGGVMSGFTALSGGATGPGNGAFIGVDADGEALDGTLQTGATLNNLGLVSAVTIDSGALIQNEGLAVGLTISSGGAIVTNNGGIVSGGVFASGATVIISGGGTALNTNSGGGGATIVLAGGLSEVGAGTAMSAVISSGAFQDIFAAGSALDTTVSAFGSATVGVGGFMGNATIVDLGAVTVLSAGILSGFTQLSGGNPIGSNPATAFVTVDFGGTALSGTLEDGALMNDNGFASAIAINSGALLQIAGEDSLATAVTASGGSVIVNSGGTMTSGLVESGANVTVLSHGSAVGGVIASGGTEHLGLPGIILGGVSISQTVSGGSLVAEADGTVTSATVENGGYLQVDFGGTATSTTVSAGGTMMVVASSGVAGVANATMVDAGATAIISSGGMASNTVIDGGTAILNSGGSITGTTQVLSGGTLVISGSGGGAGTIALGSIAAGSGGGATLVVTSQTTTNVVTSVVSGDNIRFANLAYNGGDLAGSGSTTIDGIQIVDSGNTLTVTENGIVDKLTVDNVGSFGWNLTDVDGQLNFEICFAEGTLIATPDGERVVESLAPGDMVQTLAGAKPVKWMGHRSVDVTRLRDPDAHRLIRVQKGAFADNVPHTDLLITPEHSIYVDGVFVPVRLLVNGATIARDTLIDRYTYFHVELEQHGILIANGLTTESYLDTGNRHQFANSGVTSMGIAFSENETHASWADAAAPLVVDPATTQPIWDRLAERAKDRGFVLEQVETDLEPDLHLVINDRVIRPAKALGIGIEHRYVFNLPLSLREQEGAFAARLVSKATASADVQPWIDDRRELGVMVESIVLFQHDGAPLVIDMQDDATLADGWWTWESIMGQPVRWTNGDATLPVTANTRSVEVILTAVTRYLAKPARKSKRRAA